MNKKIVTGLLLSMAFAANAYEAHEWGTFTSVVGTNGKIIQGLHHEEEALPNFVYDLSRVEKTNLSNRGTRQDPPFNGGGPVTRGFTPQSMDLMPIPTFTERITQKMETPVIYFYSDKEIDVNVRVDFPNGVISQWYPKTSKQNPSVEAKNGYAVWDVQVTTEKEGTLPNTSGNSIWNPSRKVNSNIIKAGTDAEKLIFYRGLADFDVPLTVFSKNGFVVIENKSNQDINGLTLLNNRAGKKELITIASLAANSKVSVALTKNQKGYESFDSFETFLKASKKVIVSDLVASGLYLDESKAMVGTWENGYFQTEGLRLLYVLPRVWTDEILPLAMTPAPKNLVRTLVGRVEILTDLDEEEVLKFVNSDVANDKVSIFDINGRQMQGLGHFPEPKLRRALELNISKEVKRKVNDLITSMNRGLFN
ncbi:hypothetical protein A9Q84_18700 [Halobacteriovorax marinus]|uniref:Uncharacterized protein n=1 Tax=Halobacteriovorax marinus TaxID=97084 RepID=A0A1Y5F2P8_9BACT|nr:hypothetical protein A9Q84_18700 [Halobacteriovorax marinus]